MTELLAQAIPERRRAPLALDLKGTIMNWETPSFEEIDMSAEIGSYQGEEDNGL